MKIAEYVTRYHPDKICDQISDAIVDECLRNDNDSRVAVETLGGHDTIILIGEVTTDANIDFNEIARDIYQEIVGDDIGVLSNITRQSPDIAQGVDLGGAGDQGIMIGYACNENEAFIPQELYLARRLIADYKADGKSQVVMDGNEIKSVVLSVQGFKQKDLKEYVRDELNDLEDYVTSRTQIYCNNTGVFDVGGFDSDSGCTGRKIVVDAYGPRIPVGGGAFSGKDPTKVDRSAAYMARWIALDLLHQVGGNEVLVKLGYVIGGVEPLIQEAYIDGEKHKINYDCRPEAIIEKFDLNKPIYFQTASRGHFGYINDYPWETI